ncbi:MAG: ammonia-forming cytochrome c nitrite reductase subunit c552, partial [Planctomycetota bacterium]
ETNESSVGICCESCHLGGREHAIHQKSIKFLPTSKFVKLLPRGNRDPLTDARGNARTIQGVCIQCHCGSGLRYPNGSIKTNSSEGRDMLSGFCASEIKCIDCHDPHAAGQKSGLPDLPHHVASCISCHEEYADAEFARKHSRHEASVNCLDCHMPKINQGLDDLVRTHRIMNPVEEVMVKNGSANGCNTCHLDKSTRWTLDELKIGWGREFKVDSNWPIASKIDVPLGDVWLDSDDNHLRLMAAQNASHSKSGVQFFDKVIHGLNDPEPINRVFAGFAVQKMLGRKDTEPLPVNIVLPPAERRKQILEFLEEFKRVKAELSME